MWTTITNRGALAVYGVTATLMTFTSRQKYKEAAQTLQQKLMAEEGKVTEFQRLLREQQAETEKMRMNLNTALDLNAGHPNEKVDEKNHDEAMCMALGFTLGGMLGVLGNMASKLP